MAEEKRSERPGISRQMEGKIFRSFYYLKEEMVAFCKENGLPSGGGKAEISDRIACYLDTGEILPADISRKAKAKIDVISEDSEIEPNLVCSEKHRAFFAEKIGKAFSFRVAFQKWLKENPGKTYAQAIEAYYQLLAAKKNGKTQIGKQFEYNAYIRDFFEENPGYPLASAIQCWKFKKGRQGSHRYEAADLSALDAP